MSEESTYTTSDNFIESDFSSSVCPDDSGRLVQEQPGSGCFQTGECEFECVPFFRAADCALERSEAPSSSPSISPAPTELMTAAPTPPNTIPATTIVTECPFREESVTLIQDTLSTRQVIDPVLQTVAVELQLVGSACLAFAFTDTCDATSPTNEVIVAGSPSDGSVLQYNVVPFPVADTASVIEVLPEQSQALLSGSVEQNSGVTVLEFTRGLVEDGEATVPQGGIACFVYAVGEADGPCEALSAWTRGELVIPQCATGPTIEPQTAIPATAPPTIEPQMAIPATAPPTIEPQIAIPATAAPTLTPTPPGETNAPTAEPTTAPSTAPSTLSPTRPGETRAPTTTRPSFAPTTSAPTAVPTTPAPTPSPSSSPVTTAPSQAPSTLSPTRPGETRAPTTTRPSFSPTTATPSQSPSTLSPTFIPTNAPSEAPSTLSPTRPGETRPPTTSRPSSQPTRSPSFSPTTEVPSMAPTTLSPTRFGETRPPTTPRPTPIPTKQPSNAPTGRQLEPIPVSVPILQPAPTFVVTPTAQNPNPSSAPLVLIVQGPQPAQEPSTTIIGQPPVQPLPTTLFPRSSPAPNSEQTPFHFDPSLLPPHYLPVDNIVPNPSPLADRLRGMPFTLGEPNTVAVPVPQLVPDRASCICPSIRGKSSKMRHKKSKGVNGKAAPKGKAGKGFNAWCECRNTGIGIVQYAVPPSPFSSGQIVSTPTFPTGPTLSSGHSYHTLPFQVPPRQSGDFYFAQIPTPGSSAPCDCELLGTYYTGKGKGYGRGQWTNGPCNCMMQGGAQGKGKGYARHYQIAQAFHRLETDYPH